MIFCKCFGLCPLASRDLFPPFFTNGQCHIIRDLLTSTVLAVRENIQPRSCCIDSLIQQVLGWIFSRTALTLGQLVINITLCSRTCYTYFIYFRQPIDIYFAKIVKLSSVLYKILNSVNMASMTQSARPCVRCWRN